MVVDEPAGSVFAVTVPSDSAYPAPLVVVTSTFSENVSVIVSTAVLSAVNVGGIPSEGVSATLPFSVFPAISETSCAARNTVIGVASVSIAVLNVIVTTPAELSVTLSIVFPVT